MGAMKILRFLRCTFRWCGGHVVSGTHDGEVWCGWQCDECGAVKYYEPTRRKLSSDTFDTLT